MPGFLHPLEERPACPSRLEGGHPRPSSSGVRSPLPVFGKCPSHLEGGPSFFEKSQRDLPPNGGDRPPQKIHKKDRIEMHRPCKWVLSQHEGVILGTGKGPGKGAQVKLLHTPSVNAESLRSCPDPPTTPGPAQVQPRSRLGPALVPSRSPLGGPSDAPTLPVCPITSLPHPPPPRPPSPPCCARGACRRTWLCVCCIVHGCAWSVGMHVRMHACM